VSRDKIEATNDEEILAGWSDPLDVDPVKAIRGICALAINADDAKEIIACLGLVSDLNALRATRMGSTP
jgi:hypothetical protein